MTLLQSEVGAGRAVNRSAGKNRKPKVGSAASGSAVTLLDDRRMSQLFLEAGNSDGLSRNVPVAFWLADGSCHEGNIPRVADEVMFIEANRLAPVDSEVTVRLALPRSGGVEWGVATGTVVWQCPQGDHFSNRKGFAVCLQSRWNVSLEGDEVGGTEDK